MILLDAASDIAIERGGAVSLSRAAGRTGRVPVTSVPSWLLIRRRGKLKTLVAVARSALVWHLLAEPTSRLHDLGDHAYSNRVDKEKRTGNYIRQLQTLGFVVTPGRGMNKRSTSRAVPAGWAYPGA